MFVLEYREPYRMNGIGNTKEAGMLTFRWKQSCMCEVKEPLQEMLNKMERPSEWRIEQTAH